MKKKISKTICLAVAALMLTAGLTVGTALAYFTTYATAAGGVKLDLGFAKTEISGSDAIVSEDQTTVVKPVVVKNTGKYNCYVRIKVLVGDQLKGGLFYEEPREAGAESKWAPGTSEDGYYYYSDMLAPGASTTQLNVGVVVPAGYEEFNVIVIQENATVQYDANGNPYVDWDAEADISYTITE